MVKPVSSRRTSSKSIFEAEVKTFDESIGLRMVGGGGAVLDMRWRRGWGTRGRKIPVEMSS